MIVGLKPIVIDVSNNPGKTRVEKNNNTVGFNHETKYKLPLKNIEHIFFDLDRTLWDFETNTHEVLHEILFEYQIGRNESERKKFIDEFIRLNDELWQLYRKNKVNKHELRTERFRLALLELGMGKEELSQVLSDEYIQRAPRKPHLVAFAKETLDYLKGKYTLHIITDGFKEVQHIKLSNSGIDNYFKHVITSDCTGFKKPDPGMFSYALKITGASANNSIMIGDNLEADIIGARKAGWKQVYYNAGNEKHDEEISFEIRSLKELMKLF